MIYEQFVMDLDDLSDEDIFGEQEKDLILGKSGGVFYIIYDPDIHIDLYLKYCMNKNKYLMYEDDGDSYPNSYDHNSFDFEAGDPNDGSDIGYTINKRLTYISWKRLNSDIKNRIKL